MEDLVKEYLELKKELEYKQKLYDAVLRELSSANKLLNEYRDNYEAILTKLDRFEEYEDIINELQCEV